MLIIEADTFSDKRGFFMETYHQEKYERLGIISHCVQDNLSCSVRGTLRGLHYQYPQAQAKLVQAISGEIFDVVVDIRQGSPSFGKWTGFRLSDENKRQVFVPEGFAHEFCALSEVAFVYYKCSDFYSPESEGGILWNDNDIGIEWPLIDPILSHKDRKYPRLRDVQPGRLPGYAN